MESVEFKPKSYPTNLLKKDWSKRKCYFHKGGEEFMEKIHDLEVKDDDVWLVTPPKCGTTWMQELLWLVINGFDFEGAKSEHLEVRSPFLEFDYMLYNDMGRAFKPIEGLKSPRLIKSHLPLPLLPQQLWTKKPKTVYVFRNPKDALVSDYYHMRSLGLASDQTLDEFITSQIDKNSLDHHFSMENVTEFYALRNEPWFFYTSFECMKKDLRQVINDVCKFLNKSITEEQMTKMLHHLSFDEMKKNPKTNHVWEFDQIREKLNLPFERHNFVRKGKVDGYKEELSPEVAKRLEAFVESQVAEQKITLSELLLSNECKDNALGK